MVEIFAHYFYGIHLPDDLYRYGAFHPKSNERHVRTNMEENELFLNWNQLNLGGQMEVVRT